MQILITGTNKGIGKKIKETLEKDANIFKVSKSDCLEDNYFQCDLVEKKEIDKLNFGNTIFDTIIFNAGVGHYGDFFKQDIINYEKIINLNLLSPIRLLKKLEKNITNNTKIIFIGSIASKKFLKDGSVYQASKFGIRGFAGGLKQEGKKVFIINPKIVDTTFHKDKIKLPKNITYTKIEEITKTIENIINGNEKRFEIDL